MAKESKMVTFGIVLVMGLVLIASVAVLALVMTNVATVQTNVIENAGQVSIVSVNTAGLDGAVESPALGVQAIKGVSYDLGVRVQGAADAGTCILHYQISSTAIAPADVYVEYWTGTAWTVLDPTDAGVFLEGTVGSSFALTAAYDATSILRMTFLTAGDYQTDVWAESI